MFDPAGVASCKADQADFAEEYYGALEGNQNDKFDVGFMFQRGDDFGVKYNATMACAWWIEMVDTAARVYHDRLKIKPTLGELMKWISPFYIGQMALQDFPVELKINEPPGTQEAVSQKH